MGSLSDDDTYFCYYIARRSLSLSLSHAVLVLCLGMAPLNSSLQTAVWRSQVCILQLAMPQLIHVGGGRHGDSVWVHVGSHASYPAVDHAAAEAQRCAQARQDAHRLGVVDQTGGNRVHDEGITLPVPVYELLLG